MPHATKSQDLLQLLELQMVLLRLKASRVTLRHADEAEAERAWAGVEDVLVAMLSEIERLDASARAGGLRVL